MDEPGGLDMACDLRIFEGGDEAAICLVRSDLFLGPGHNLVTLIGQDRYSGLFRSSKRRIWLCCLVLFLHGPLHDVDCTR